MELENVRDLRWSLIDSELKVLVKSRVRNGLGGSSPPQPIRLGGGMQTRQI